MAEVNQIAPVEGEEKKEAVVHDRFRNKYEYY